MSKSKEVTNLIERMEVFEERLFVRLESISAWIENGGHREYQVRVSGELHSRNGTDIKQITRVIVDVYDASGRILGTNNWIADFLESIDPNKFFGFHTFSVEAEIPVTHIAKIRVYPKRCKE
jgi:hypothetical protein